MNDDALVALLAQPRLAKVLDVLDGGGEETRVVGGAVRNTLIGLPVDDIDLATTAEPPAVIARATAARLRVVPTGIAHGTVTILVEGRPFEVTTLRRDVETDGRHAVVAFGRDFDADAQRRDFTINALSLSRDGVLHDPVGGVADLRARKVRFIGDARTRIHEDYLRILRLFRFHAAYGDGALDRQARDAAIAERNGLARLSAERLNLELSKLLVARRAAEVVAEMAETGLLTLLIGGVADTGCLARAIALSQARPPGAVARLGALAVAVREDVARLRERFRLSNAATKRLEDVAAMLEQTSGKTLEQADVDTLLFRFPRDTVGDALILTQARSTTSVDDARWQALRDHAAHAPVPAFPVSGDDLLRQGVPPGRHVGAALKALQARWIRAGFPRDPAIIARLVAEAVQEVG